MATIRISGARQHNLKNLSLEIPRHQLVVITGVSGSGKSSLAFDTLYAEGQRRYVESLSAYARQFLDQLEKPDVDFIEGLSPSIAIEQRSSAPNPRSTIATTTETLDYLRILFASIGIPHDPSTGDPLIRHTPASILQEFLALPAKARLVLLAPLQPNQGEPFPDFVERLKGQGFLRLRLNGVIRELEEPDLPSEAPKEIQLVTDRIVIREDIRSRIADSIETTLDWSGDTIQALVQTSRDAEEEVLTYYTAYRNPETGFHLPALTPRHFSFNSHLGACPTCQGLGTQLVPDPELFVPNPDLSIEAGGIKTWWTGSAKRKGLHQRSIRGLALHFSADLDAPIRSLPKEFKRALFFGTGSVAVPVDDQTDAGAKAFEGLSVQANRLLKTSDSEVTKRNVRRFMSPKPCPSCNGKRMKGEILSVLLPHHEDPRSIHDFTSLSIERAAAWLEGVTLTATQELFARELLREIQKRLSFLQEVGLGYLTLDRESGTLSGGESQRIRLATQLGAGLAGVLYVLDEPSIGLHQADNERLIGTLQRLRDLGNSIIVVEHDEDTIRVADHLIDIGPGAGEHGGQLLAQGTPEEVAKHPSSLTGKYLSGQECIAIPSQRTTPPPRPKTAKGKRKKPSLDSGWIEILGATEHNLQEVDAAFPLGCLTCITGSSGSGKSTLIDGILRRILFRHFHQSKDIPGSHQEFRGIEQIDKAIVIDQTPIGRSPRSNPATYTGVFGPIRDLYQELPLSRQRGYGPGRFSFNVAGGRCETCQGDGSIKIDMHFLSDVYVTCETCQGKRYNQETLQVSYRGKSISDVLDLEIEEAKAFFQKIPAIHAKLRALTEVGLGYLKLGQPANTLSGGEAQRIKLATELSKKATGKTLYMFDEPTTGLHFHDIRTLMEVFYALRNSGNTLIVIEHNLDVIKCADWILDLGPGGGEHGGKLVAEGTPEEVAEEKESLTGKYLKQVL
ncbi:MAG: excinuclease ABC subunit UvrA [Verrucomicrobiota bacterium]